MEKKSLIMVISVLLNLVLVAALIGFNKFNTTIGEAPAPYLVVQHMNDSGPVQSDGHEIASASTTK